MKLVWDSVGNKIYETGVDHAVLYPQDAEGKYPKGVAWNGISAFNETPSGADASTIWADNLKYVTLRAQEEFGATIEAYMYPDEWAYCDGSATPIAGVTFGQQKRHPFGFSCRTIIGNDTEYDEHGYKLHLMYNATASPSERSYATVNDSPEAITFSWEVTTVPVPTTVKVDGKELKPVSCITINSTTFGDKTKLTALEDILYGTADTEARLPLPDEVYSLLGGSAATTNTEG